MRKHLADKISTQNLSHLNLKGNARNNRGTLRRKRRVVISLMTRSSVGVGISFFIKRHDNTDAHAEIFYARVDEFWRKEDKYRYLDSKEHYQNPEWKPITPDRRYTWLTEGLHAEFETFIPIGTQEAKAEQSEGRDVIFQTYSNGVKTNRDAWAYNFNRNVLAENISGMIDTYNAEVDRWKRRVNWDENVDDFVVSGEAKIKWSGDLKLKLKSGTTTNFSQEKVRVSLYRPFTESNLYFDRVVNNRVYVFPSIFPTPETERRESSDMCSRSEMLLGRRLC